MGIHAYLGTSSHTKTTEGHKSEHTIQTWSDKPMAQWKVVAIATLSEVMGLSRYQ